MSAPPGPGPRKAALVLCLRAATARAKGITVPPDYRQAECIECGAVVLVGPAALAKARAAGAVATVFGCDGCPAPRAGRGLDRIESEEGTEAVSDDDPLDPANPWERMTSEGARAFAAFAVYRDAGPGRSLAAVAAAVRVDAPGRKATEGIQAGKRRATVPGYICKWSATWRWKERAEAWDDHLAAARGRAELQAATANTFDLARERMRAVRAGVAFGSLCRRRARELLDLATAPAEPGVTRPAPDARTLAAAATVGRIGTEIIWEALGHASAAEAAAPGVAPLSLDQTAEAMRLADQIWNDWQAKKKAMRDEAPPRPRLAGPDHTIEAEVS